MARKRKPKSDNPDLESLLLDRITDCDAVLKHLDGCPAWRVIIADLDAQKKMIDDNWHQTNDEKKIAEFRITKFAIMHLINIKKKYEDDLNDAQTKLFQLRNQVTNIMKDYDSE